MNDSEPVREQRLGCGMIALAWLVLLGLLYLLFADELDRQFNPNRSLSPQATKDATELVLKQNRSGHYIAPGAINGHSVVFLLDTGATVVSVPAHLAATLGLAAGAQQWVTTANGEVSVHATRIAVLSLGPFHLRNVRANLNPGLSGDAVLLGMSALRRLELTQRGDTLTLHAMAEGK
ncbi:MAG: TIGR02281 family clan AA aspartic protease [Candidatus Competibacteraceae bacterium]|nr:TIGR02281 family clan AA aspartic protease [Candidatus Competibacteraceae bacterium]